MPIPIRTPAGEDELRHRTRKLSQRHRTMLLLVDSRRPLDELLSLAQKAGAAVGHFDELVELGLVELPVETPVPEAAAEAPVAAAIDDDEAAAAMPASEEDEGNVLPVPPVVDFPPPVDVIAAPPTAPSAAAAPKVAEPLLPPVRIDQAPTVEASPEEELLQEVRDLLIDTLRIDSPLFGARTFFRVRSAQSTNELMDLVWEIEDHLAHSRHSHDELISLQRARELLGMGNTRVAGDTQPGPHD